MKSIDKSVPIKESAQDEHVCRNQQHSHQNPGADFVFFLFEEVEGVIKVLVIDDD